MGAPVAGQAEDWTEQVIDKLLLEMMNGQNMSVKDAAAFVAAQSGIKKRDVYQRALILSQKKK